MLDFRRASRAAMNSVESFSDSGSWSDTESPLESSAAKAPFQDQGQDKLTTVDIRGQAYRVPKLLSKQFYLDLTYMEDEELISKYALVKYKHPSAQWRSRSLEHRRT